LGLFDFDWFVGLVGVGFLVLAVDLVLDWCSGLDWLVMIGYLCDCFLIFNGMIMIDDVD